MGGSVKLVLPKTGVSQDVAEKAVETVLGYLKEKLLAPIAAQIEGGLGEAGAAEYLEDLTKGLGRLLEER